MNRDRIGNGDSTTNQLATLPDSKEVASRAVPMWWEDHIRRPFGFAPHRRSVDVAQLAQVSLASSPYVQGLLTEPKIRCNDLVIADAEFHTLAFIDGKFSAANDPVGSALTTGDGSDRFRDDLFTSAAA